MRIVYLNPANGLGGAERSLIDLMASVRSEAADIRLALIVPDEGPLARRAREIDVDVHTLPMPRGLASVGDSGLRHADGKRALALAGLRYVAAAGAVLPFAASLHAKIRELRPSLIHSNGIKHHLLGAIVRQRGTPLVWHVRDFLSERKLAAPLLRLAARRATVAIASANAVAEDARRVLTGLPVHVVHNAIDTEAFASAVGDGQLLDDLSRMPSATPNTVRVGLVATYARWKGQDAFLQAARRVVSASPTSTRFYIVGGPIYDTRDSQFSEQELRQMVHELGLSHCVGLVPFTEEVAPIFRALDVVVHASTRPEPFGRTIVEGMAAARPVVVAAAGGAIELFSDGEDGIATRPGDIEGLARAIQRLVDNRELRHKLGECAQDTARRRFSRQRLGREVLDLYRSVLSSERTKDEDA